MPSPDQSFPSVSRSAASADLVVVGSGVAGLTAALAAADRGASVLLLTGGPLMAGSSPRAQGGVAAAVGSDDSPALHARDTLAVGGGLNDRLAVSVLVSDGALAARRLLDQGVPFDGGPVHPELGLEAGHGRHRILHAGGGATGAALTGALVARAVEHLRIVVHTHTPVARLLLEGNRAVGVQAEDGRRYHAPAVILATGGFGGLWQRTTNAPETRGSGLRLAFAAGASLADLELVQFHPTALDLPGKPAYLLTEAIRGEGAQLLDARQQPFVDPLLPRDVVARAIHRQRQTGPVYLSLRHLDAAHVRSRFPNIAAQLAEWDLDLATDLIPIAPAAHYCMGGVRTDSWGRTDVPGLFAVGEVACSGAQGANRLASNSLLECLVFGARASREALSVAESAPGAWPVWSTSLLNADLPAARGTRNDSVPPRLGARLDEDLGVERNGDCLAHLVADLPDVDQPDAGDAWLAGVAARSAWLRTESRGAHYRSDFPLTDDARWHGRIHWRLNQPPAFEEVAA